MERFLQRIKDYEARYQVKGADKLSSESDRKLVEKYQPQKILLSTWIVELKLNEINKIKIKSEGTGTDQATFQDQQFVLDQLEKEFWEFLNENFPNKQIIDQILQNHGKINKTSRSPKDYINKKDYKGALDCILETPDEETRFALIKKYSLIFLQKDIEYTLETLKSSQFKKMDFSELVPSFADISANHEDKIPLMLEFLRDHCIERLRSEDKIIHNMAFYFMTKLPDLEPLIYYLQFLEVSNEQKRIVGLDLEYAFNQCNQIQHERKSKKIKDYLQKAQIIIYAILGLYEKAVDLSIATQNYEFAKKYASKSFIDKKLKKNMWLKIGKSILSRSESGKLSNHNKV